MREFLRKCRGALGLGVTWAVMFAVIFTSIALVIGVLDPDSIDAGEGPATTSRIGAAVGFVSGTAFALFLSLGEARKRIRNLSFTRAALWGAAGAAVWPLLTPVDNRMLIILCPIGAALAVATLAVARKAESTELSR